MNVVYSLSVLPDWIEIAKNMQKRAGWEPLLWISTNDLTNQINNAFPLCKVQEYMSGNRGDFKIFQSNNDYMPLDKETIISYSENENTILKMMDRMDPTQRNLSYTERINLYYRLLTYWLYVFDTHDIECVVFNEMPHFPLDYILYSVAQKKGIKVFRFSSTHVASRVMLFGCLEKTPNYFNKYDKEKELSNDVSLYLTRMEGEYSKAIPFYMNQVLNSSFGVKNINRWIKKGCQYLIYPPESPLKAKKGFVSILKFSGLYLGYYRIRGNIYKRYLRKEYNTLVKDVNLEKKYIYIPLHYQPERTTSPEGGVFSNQYLMVSMLSKSIPKGWRIYVKEHTSQFSPKLYGERGRSKSFYRDILELGNVDLIPFSYGAFDLIDSAQVVATVTGTSALEAINRGKYAFVFGYVWFSSCEGIERVENKEDITKVLDKIERKQTPSKTKIRNFFRSIDQNSVIGYTGEGTVKITSRISSDENIENLTTLLYNYQNKI